MAVSQWQHNGLAAPCPAPANRRHLSFAPVVAVAAIPNFLVVVPSSPDTALRAVIDAARTQPEVLRYARGGMRSTPHLSGEMLKVMAKVKIQETPYYKGAAPALIDVLAGRVSMGFDSVGTSIKYVKAGRLYALALTSLKCTSSLPEVPTIAEQGYAEFDVVAWMGIWTIAGVPRKIVHACEYMRRPGVGMRQRNTEPECDSVM